ncbi:MAG: HPF/RaiA family ribosome-associated protein [Oceanihabitans sp.]|nr:HPF/RaiA family ribosome-associated protein [Oceanihabitans sp.]
MTINFEYHDVEASKKLEAFTTEKLERLFVKFSMIIRADVCLKTEKTALDATDKTCNIRLSVFGPRLYAHSNQDSFMNSISKSISDLDSQLAMKRGKMTKL